MQLAHERDVVTAEQLSGSYTLDTSVQSINCTRFTVWATEVMCPLINESRSTPSDNLYFVTAAADSIAATSDAELRQVFQGAVTATCSSVNATADKNVGKLLLHFSVDLYGFTNVAADVLPSHRRATMPRSSLGPSSGAEVKRQPPSRDDSKELPDVDLTDFVNLTPKSNRLLVQTVDPSIQLPLVRAVQPTPPPSARVSSKK